MHHNGFHRLKVYYFWKLLGGAQKHFLVLLLLFHEPNFLNETTNDCYVTPTNNHILKQMIPVWQGIPAKNLTATCKA